MMIRTNVRPDRLFKVASYVWIIAWLVIWPFYPSMAWAKSLQLQALSDDFGPDAIWDPYSGNTPGGIEARNCYFSGTAPLDCVLSVMQDSGAPPQAIKFVEMTNGETFMVSFEETGTVDIAGVVYPERANGNFQYMLLNGAQEVVRADADYLYDTISSSLQDRPLYFSLWQTFPDISLWIWDNKFEGAQTLPSGGQRFVFSYLLRNGCHACDVLAHAFVAFNFDSEGVFEGVNLITLVTPENYERTRSRFQANVLSSDEQIGSISYIGQDGNLWLVDISNNQQQPLVQLSEGKVIAYDWSYKGNQVVYVKEIGEKRTEIHLLEVGSNESALLVSDANYDPWGGIAFSPSGQHVAFTSNSVDVELLNVDDKSSTVIFHADGVGVGGGAPRTRRGLNWSSDGKYLAVDMYATGSVVLSLEDTPRPEIQSLFPTFRANPTFAPSEPRIAWIDLETQEALIITDIEGNALAKIPVYNCHLGMNSTLSWSPSASEIAVSSAKGLCVIDVETGAADNLVSDQGTFHVQWSDDGEWMLFQYVEGIGTMRVFEQTIGMVNSDGSKIFDLGVYGSMPSWTSLGAVLDGTDIGDFLTRKEATIPQLEETSVDIVGLPFPVSAFDETAAQDLIQRVRLENDENSLTPEQAEAFVRATLQEESLAAMLPLYSQASADFAEVATDIVGVGLATDRQAERALQGCFASGNPFSGVCLKLRRMIERKTMNIINSFGKVVIRFLPDPERQKEFQEFWGLLVDGVTLELDGGAQDVLQDILLGTVVKGVAVDLYVRYYVGEIQPFLNQGVRSADPNYTGSESVWPVEDQVERATIHTESLVEQATMEAEYAHSAHEDLMRGVDMTELIADMGDIAQLSPWAALARLVSFFSRVEHLFIDMYAVNVNLDSMDCTRYLSSRAGSLAFNPDQPGESCRDMSSLRPSLPHMARESRRKGDIAAWRRAWLRVSDSSEIYDDAVESLLVAIRDGDDTGVIEALNDLDKADQTFESASGQATSIILHSDVLNSDMVEVISKSNQFSLDALDLYLLVASYVTAPKDERVPVADIEQVARATLSSLEAYDDALAVAVPTANESNPLPIIHAIALPDQVKVEEPFNIALSIQNIGTARATEVDIKSHVIGQEVQVVQVESLEASQIYTANLKVQAVHTGTLTLLTQVTTDGSMTDSQIHQINVGLESSDVSVTPQPTEDMNKPQPTEDTSESQPPEDTSKPRSGLCPGTVAPLLVVAVLFLVDKKWPLLKS